MEMYLLIIVLLLLVLAIVQIRIAWLLSRQVRQNKEVEDAVYRLIEVTKENTKGTGLQ
ncbi:hypothetical protein ACFFNY_21620 [Paenibacillus hodogayensis]|uniref:DUF4083 domain-containing protein n=1 Tax=Paenibacillus hodogayensis TaxID=279208 RepID=A0ABV5W1Q9_9BACL